MVVVVHIKEPATGLYRRYCKLLALNLREWLTERTYHFS
jgi:hypothetical protein